MIGHRSEHEQEPVGNVFPHFRTTARSDDPATLLTEVQGLRGEVSEGLTAIRETLSAMLEVLRKETGK